jgi:sugar-specific transcriptional regulator TrmB
MDETLLKLLEQAGFTEKEARVYLALLELGRGRVSDIAKKADLKRTIIYVILEGLIKRGYVTEVPGGKINIYQSIDPSSIIDQLKTVTKNFSEMLPVFRTLSSKGKRRPKISYHESKQSILKVYDEMSNAKEAFMVSAYSRLQKHFPGAIENWTENLTKGIYELKAKHLIPHKPNEIEIGRQFIRAKQKVKTLIDLRNLNMDFVIYKNKLAITSLEDELFMVVIESEELVKSMLPLFEIAWQKGEEIKDVKQENIPKARYA